VSCDPTCWCSAATSPWGPLPEETLALLRELRVPRSSCAATRSGPLLEPAERSERARWLLERHSEEARAFLSTFVARVVVAVEGLGPVYFCHVSPRSDEELVTPETPAARIRAMTAGVAERTVVSAHSHVQFDRQVAGIRSVNAGSVGMPYEGRPGAFWALLGPDVDLRRTDDPLEEAVARYRASGDPLAEQMIEVLARPPTRAEAIEHAERLGSSG
jgi:hypothetical protein